jgi:hypothetical protein
MDLFEVFLIEWKPGDPERRAVSRPAKAPKKPSFFASLAGKLKKPKEKKSVLPIPEDPDEKKRQEKLAALEAQAKSKSSKKADDGGSWESRMRERPEDESKEEVGKLQVRAGVKRASDDVKKDVGELATFFSAADGYGAKEPAVVSTILGTKDEVDDQFEQMVDAIKKADDVG